MLLSCRFLVGVAGVNSFQYADRASLTEGDSGSIYLQLVDQLLDTQDQGFYPPYRRFVPAAGATLQVTLDSLDASRVVVKTATQPFPGDASIWSFTVSPSDKLRGSIVLRLGLNQGGTYTYGVLQPGLAVKAK